MAKIKSYLSAPVLCLCVYILLSISNSITLPENQSSTNIFLALIVMQILIFLLPSFFYITLKGKKKFSNIKVKPFKPKYIPLILTSSVILFLGSALLKVALGAKENLININSASPDASQVFFIIIVYCILPAFLEEYLFRGIILSEYSQFGIFTSVLISSVFFAMLHFSFSYFLVYLFSGILLSLVLYVTRSLLACMTVHIINNVFVILCENKLWNIIQQPENIFVFSFILIALTLLFIFIAFHQAEYIIYSYAFSKDGNSEMIPVKQRIDGFFRSILSPTFIICIVYFIIISLT